MMQAPPETPPGDHVPSPCIRLCTLDQSDVCVGCYRKLDDIIAWRGLDPAERLAVLAAADRRRAAAGIGGPGRQGE